jgi:aldose sugar dehydrogenase
MAAPHEKDKRGSDASRHLAGWPKPSYFPSFGFALLNVEDVMRIRWLVCRKVLVALSFWAVSGGIAQAAQTNAPAPAAPSKIKVETVAAGLRYPWGLQFLPDGRLLVTERSGELRIVTKAGAIGPPVEGVPTVMTVGQGGLLDVALAPDFSTSFLIYLSYSEPRDGFKNGTSVARAKLVLEKDGGRLDGLSVIFQQQPAVASTFHFGSRIVFAPDGSLFVTTGERNFAKSESQNAGNHIGKVIHILPDGTPAPGNPQKDGWDPKVWSIGHRNIQGAAIDPVSGQLWTVEHGARGGDELNRPEAGKNYGWPIISYGRDYSGVKIGEGTSKPGMEQPIYYWDPSIATSGLAIYTGNVFANWNGNLFVGGLRGAHLARLVVKDGQVIGHERLLDDLAERIRDVRQGPDGALWVLTDDGSDGKILRLVPES